MRGDGDRPDRDYYHVPCYHDSRRAPASGCAVRQRRHDLPVRTRISRGAKNFPLTFRRFYDTIGLALMVHCIVRTPPQRAAAAAESGSAGHGREISASEHPKAFAFRGGRRARTLRYRGKSERHAPLTWVVPRNLFRPMQLHGTFLLIRICAGKNSADGAFCAGPALPKA